jgi:site-specific DNA-methyltransferase (cytosine-N4-specific)
MSEDKIKNFNPDVFATFEQILSKNYLHLLDFNKVCCNSAFVKIYDHNSSNSIPNEIVAKESVDLIITSPPYGDSSTTVAYGQFSAMANQWLFNMEVPRTLDKKLMGGIAAKRFSKSNSEILNHQVNEISKIDIPRALEVISFYRDYRNSILKNLNQSQIKGLRLLL